jgi:oxygen-independent coproporphyrinogen-3 oxidase
MNTSISSLLKKYDQPIPRYTSYPTVPYWDVTGINEEKWKKEVLETYRSGNGEICIYIHLPFCENLCTFCACNKRITKNHGVEEPYLQAVCKEWEIYKTWLPGKPVIKEIHLGGGTPTFFSAENLANLIREITGDCEVAEDHSFSVEVHPNYTTEEHIKGLQSVGFNRISLGVQDFDPVVQYAINRIQSFEKTNEVVDWARKHRFSSINIDLVYGLPHQTTGSIEHTVNEINRMKPDRIAFYSYAHVPWKSKGQRRYTEKDLPTTDQKWEMYMLGTEMFKSSGYKGIGMDHFALEKDSLFLAASNGNLHRNFMGYTTTASKLIIALGASSISDAWGAFIQNDKEIESYEEKINLGHLPITDGHLLNREDMILRKNILELMCKNETVFQPEFLEEGFIKDAKIKLKAMEADELVLLEGNKIIVTNKGKSFIRNISAAIDAQLWRKQMAKPAFSRSI